MAIVGEAFIAIKPDTSTFSRETTKAVDREMSKAAKSAADAFEKAFDPDVQRVAQAILDESALDRQAAEVGESVADVMTRAFERGFKFDVEGQLRDDKGKVVRIGEDIGSDIAAAIGNSIDRANLADNARRVAGDLERGLRGFDPPNLKDRVADALPSNAEAERLGRRVGDQIGDGIAKEVDDTNVRGKVGAGFGRLAGFAAAAFSGGLLAAGIGAGVVKSIDAASDLGEAQNKVDVVFGQSAETVSAFADTAAESLGVAESKALEFSGTFGNLLRSVGLSEEQAATMSTSLVQLGADLGSFNNIDVTEALDKLRAGLTGEAEPLKTLGVNLNDATLTAKALELGLLQGVQDSDKIAEARKKVAEATQELADAQAGADPEKVAAAQRAVETAQNGVVKAQEAARRKQEALNDAVAKSGENSEAAVRAAFDLEQANLAIAAAQDKVAESQTKLARVGESAGPGSAAALKAQEDLDKANKGLETALEGKVPATLDAATKAQAAYALILEQTALAQGDFARTAETSLPNQIKTLKAGFEDALAGVGVDLIPVATQVVKTLGDAIGPAFEDIGPVLAGVAEQFGPILTTVFEGLAEVTPEISGLLRSIFGGLGEILEEVGPELLPIISRIADGLAFLFDEGLSAAAPLLGTLAGAFTRLLDAIAPLAEIGIGIVTQLFGALEPVLPPIVDALGDIALVLGEGLADLFVAIGPPLTKVAGIFGGLLARALPIVARLFERLSPVIEKIAESFGDVFDKVLPIVSENLNTFMTALEPVIDALGLALLDVLEELAPHLPDLVRSFTEMSIAFSELLVSLTPLLPPLVTFIGFWSDNVTANALMIFVEAFTLWNDVLADAVGIIGDVVGGISIFLTSLDDIPAKIGGVLTSVGETFLGVFEDAKTFVSNVVGEILSLPGKIITLPGEIAAVFVDVGSSILEGIIDGLTEAGGFAVDIAKDIGNAVIDFLNEHVIGGLNDLLEFDVPLPLGRKITINPPDLPPIPNLASGAFHPATSGGLVARVGEAGFDEATIPLPKDVRAGLAALAAVGSSGGLRGDSLSVVVQGGATGPQTAREIVLAWRGERFRRGR